jgi:hypothetical protein
MGVMDIGLDGWTSDWLFIYLVRLVECDIFTIFEPFKCGTTVLRDIDAGALWVWV